ncbi:MAG TPA: response regulator [Candidatus Angelobacter sp.]|nr:response regulator [Candidatus Angelobacter sp.]
MSTTPTVYFIDDSATMREVIKIAFRRENIQVVACHDAASALSEIEKAKPDVIITDVIMPEKDGYQVCEYIKSHPALSKIPVILMSGVVNRSVAEKAFAVKADELLRKPFQPQDLIARVKHLLKPNGAPAPTQASATSAAVALSSIFSGAAPQARPAVASPLPPQSVPAVAPRAVSVASGIPPSAPAAAASSSPAAVATLSPPPPAPIFSPAALPAPLPSVSAPPVASTHISSTHLSASIGMSMPGLAKPVAPAPVAANVNAAVNATNDATKLKIEILRLEGLVKKLQSELHAEREYSRALEAHIKTLQESE